MNTLYSLQIVGKWSYYFILFCYCVFLTSLTTFILTTPSPLAYPQFYNCSEYFTNLSSRPVISNMVAVEVEHTQLHYWAKIGVLVMFVMYCGRFVIEETPLVLLKV